MKIKDRVKPKLPPVEAGVYAGICVGIYDLGEQYSEFYKKYSNKVMFTFELPTETIEVDGKQEPRQLSKEFAIASGKKSSLRAFLSAWNSKNYTDEEFADLEIFQQLGKAAMINVVLNDSGEYANIDSVMPLMKGYPVPKSETAQLTWDMDKWDDEAFAALPEWVQEKIKKSTNYQKGHAPETTVAVTEQTEDCPI